MRIQFEIPKDIEEQLGAGGRDPSQTAKEHVLVAFFRRGLLTHAQLAQSLGLDGLEADALLKHHGVAEPVPTDDEVDADRGGAVRLGRAQVPVRTFIIGAQSEEQLLKETLLAWQSRGPAAAWQAMFDLLGWWFEAWGLDPEAQRVDRGHIEVRRVPWQGSLAERDADA